MSEHKKQHRKSIRFFNDREVRAVWDEEQNCWWFFQQQTLFVPLTTNPTILKLVTIGDG
mgnify:FL=1